MRIIKDQKKAVINRKILIFILSLTGLFISLHSNTLKAQNEESLSVLNTRVASLQHELQLLEDESDIEILQKTYGYYVDKNLWEQISELFTDDGTLEIGGRGIFSGKARVLEYLQWLGEPVHGRLYDHTQLQPVVHVSPDGTTAKGRWRALVFGGDYERSSILGDVIYENEYRKEGEVWKISKLHAYFIMYTTMDRGWESFGWANTRPEKDLPPDLPPTVVYDMYPGELTAPEHYPNPVTGGPIFENVDATPLKLEYSSADELSALLTQLNQRVGLLSDAQAIENLQNAYGYYFDKRQWDDAADLFADDGTSEREQYGVYVGKQRVRESFELYGEAGIAQGNGNNNILYQPIIHVDEDGLSAKGRLRIFSMLGDYQGDATISGGVFENEYVKDGGIWKIKSDHLYTTYIAEYATGWSHGSLPVAGQSEVLPPDLPPTLEYEAFPNYYIVPFHYDNPVTGEAPVVP